MKDRKILEILHAKDDRIAELEQVGSLINPSRLN